MTPTHANRKGRRYRYSLSSDLIGGRRKEGEGGPVRSGARRIPAADVEAVVDGTRALELSADRLLKAGPVSPNWSEQLAAYGFA